MNLEGHEPSYFRGFRVPRVVISIKGLGKNPTQVVEHAITRAKGEEFNQVWCVFDRDSFPVSVLLKLLH